MRRLGLVGCLLAGTAGVAHAQETFTPQTLTVQESIAPGANVFVLHQAWAGPSVVSVLGADDLSMKGNMTPGTTAQMTLTKDAKTLYTTSVYMKRMVYGDVEIVLHEGRNHIVRRMLDEVGHPVLALVRTRIGPIALGQQRPGTVRVLSGPECRALYTEAGL